MKLADEQKAEKKAADEEAAGVEMIDTSSKPKPKPGIRYQDGKQDNDAAERTLSSDEDSQASKWQEVPYDDSSSSSSADEVQHDQNDDYLTQAKVNKERQMVL